MNIIGLGVNNRLIWPNSLSGLIHRGFTPSALFALGEQGAWYDPSDLTTMYQDAAGITPVTAAGQPVGLMLDKSGRGNHATQATAAARPTYQTSGGLHWIAFDGADDFMVTGTITPGVDKAQVFAGVRKIGAITAGIIAELSSSAASNNGVFVLAGPNDLTNDYSWRSKGTGSNAILLTGFPSPISNVLTGIGDISGDISTLRINGTQAGQSTTDQGTGNFLAYPLYIGARAGTSFFFNGRIYGLTVRFGPNLSAGEIASTEAYMAAKTGVTL